jgi:hypothetical protein
MLELLQQHGLHLVQVWAGRHARALHLQGLCLCGPVTGSPVMDGVMWSYARSR